MTLNMFAQNHFLAIGCIYPKSRKPEKAYIRFLRRSLSHTLIRDLIIFSKVCHVPSRHPVRPPHIQIIYLSDWDLI